jgi:hypothetical protein
VIVDLKVSPELGAAAYDRRLEVESLHHVRLLARSADCSHRRISGHEGGYSTSLGSSPLEDQNPETRRVWRHSLKGRYEMRICGRRALGATAVAAVALAGTVSVAGAAAPPKFQVTVTDDFSSGGIEFVVQPVPPVVEPVTVKLGFANNSVAPHVLVVVGGLPNGITVDEFIDLIDAVNAGAPPPEGSFEAGAVFSKPGQDHQKLFDLTTEGQYGFFCPITSPDGTPHYKEGFVGLFEVAAP